MSLVSTSSTWSYTFTTGGTFFLTARSTVAGMGTYSFQLTQEAP